MLESYYEGKLVSIDRHMLKIEGEDPIYHPLADEDDFFNDMLTHVRKGMDVRYVIENDGRQRTYEFSWKENTGGMLRFKETVR